mmetsp:Transcript_5708/g.20348  ORF Transcript_5708/g.20348 Transcript_5708/m.20348 type:complete len:211 (-) Transcript_5708:441-1073(-)
MGPCRRKLRRSSVVVAVAVVVPRRRPAAAPLVPRDGRGSSRRAGRGSRSAARRLARGMNRGPSTAAGRREAARRASGAPSSAAGRVVVVRVGIGLGVGRRLGLRRRKDGDPLFDGDGELAVREAREDLFDNLLHASNFPCGGEPRRKRGPKPRALHALKDALDLPFSRLSRPRRLELRRGHSARRLEPRAKGRRLPPVRQPTDRRADEAP